MQFMKTQRMGLAHRLLFVLLGIVASGFAQSQTVPPGPTSVNDTYATNQWNLTAINAPQAWNLLATNTKKVRVATIDSDNSVHTDIRWTRDAVGQPLVKEFPIYWGGSFQRENISHGTHVAGIIAAISNNVQGVAGICKQCEILPVIISSDTDEALAAAIKLAVRLDAQVINMSLELRNDQALSKSCSATSNPLTYDAINKAINAGVTVVASAGNYGKTFDVGASDSQRNVRDVTPASCPGVISVGATDQSGKMSSYTNVGATLMAPGGSAGAKDGAFGAGVGCIEELKGFDGKVLATSKVGVLSTWRDNKNTKCYRYVSGTSMAAPHVSGVVGLMLAANQALTPSQVKEILQNPANATTVANCTSGACGAGLLDAAKAVNMALGTRGSALTYTGVCRFAAGETCKIDTLDELPNGNISITAYGKIWNFSSGGALIGTPLALTTMSVYTRPNGPCSAGIRPDSGLCTFDVRTVVDYPGVGYLDSVGVSYKYWNYVASGQPFGPEGGSVYGVPRYKAMCGIYYSGSSLCQFETRLVVNFPEWGGVIESITYHGQYWNFDGAGNLLAGVSGNGPLTGVNRYKAICGLKPSGSQYCTFDSRDIKNNRNEVITAYGWYFEFSGEQLIKQFKLLDTPPFR